MNYIGTIQTTIYPHITANRAILGGIPIIEGTRTSVRSIAGYFNLGMSHDEILEALPHLSPAELYAALTYYFDHRAEVDKDIAENNDTSRWKALAEASRANA